jgi:hypothetical protein
VDLEIEHSLQIYHFVGHMEFILRLDVLKSLEKEEGHVTFFFGGGEIFIVSFLHEYII